MNIFLKCLVKTLLAPALLVGGVAFAADELPSDAAVIEFKNHPEWTAENYLTFLLTKIPMAQVHVQSSTAEDTIRITGPIRIAFKNLPEALKVELTVELGRAFKGERTISGAVLETSDAQLILVSEEPALPTALALQRHVTMEELGFVRTPVDSEQLKREVEERQRREAKQLSESRSCGRFLGHIEK